jgi:CRP-like cAMP-binding protein
LASTTLRHPPGTILLARGVASRAVALIADGSVQASVTAANGRHVTFKLDSRRRVYGMLSFVDGREMPSDIVAIEPTLAISIPFAAIRAELDADPALWPSIALDVCTRARGFTDQLKAVVFDPLPARVASLLTALAIESGQAIDGSSEVRLRLSQERLGEMLGVSRQTVTTLVRQLNRNGILEWRYGTVTLRDPVRLRQLSGPTIDRD